MKDDDNGFLREIALGMAMLSRKQKRTINTFIKLISAMGFTFYDTFELIEVEWTISKQHYSTIMYLLRSLRNTNFTLTSFDMFYERFFFAGKSSDNEFISIKLHCHARDLLLFFFLLFCLGSGHIRYTDGGQIMPRDKAFRYKTLKSLFGKLRALKTSNNFNRSGTGQRCKG